jgi:hypothetical protein
MSQDLSFVALKLLKFSYVRVYEKKTEKDSKIIIMKKYYN